MSAVAVSVVMPAFNAADTIAEAIESILAEVSVSLELLVVDDGSTDATQELCRQLAGRDPRLRLLRHPGGEQRGVGPSRQLAIEHARGHAVAFLDADDLALPGRLPFQLTLLERYPRAVLAHGAMRAFGFPESFGRHLEAWMNLGDERSYRLWRRHDALWYNRIANSSVLVRRAHLVHVPIPALRYQYEDWATWLLLGRRGPFVFHPRPVVRYRLHPGAFTTHHRNKGGAQGHLRATSEMLRAVERGLAPASLARLRVRGRRLLVAAALAVGDRLEPSARV